MDITEALQIVIDLAKFGLESRATTAEQYQRYNEAIAIVEDMAVNQFGDD